MKQLGEYLHNLTRDPERLTWLEGKTAAHKENVRNVKNLRHSAGNVTVEALVEKMRGDLPPLGPRARATVARVIQAAVRDRAGFEAVLEREGALLRCMAADRAKLTVISDGLFNRLRRVMGRDRAKDKEDKEDKEDTGALLGNPMFFFFFFFFFFCSC
jgi:hypothetical protein